MKTLLWYIQNRLWWCNQISLICHLTECFVFMCLRTAFGCNSCGHFLQVTFSAFGLLSQSPSLSLEFFLVLWILMLWLFSLNGELNSSPHLLQPHLWPAWTPKMWFLMYFSEGWDLLQMLHWNFPSEFFSIWYLSFLCCSAKPFIWCKTSCARPGEIEPLDSFALPFVSFASHPDEAIFFWCVRIWL